MPTFVMPTQFTYGYYESPVNIGPYGFDGYSYVPIRYTQEAPPVARVGKPPRLPNLPDDGITVENIDGSQSVRPQWTQGQQWAHSVWQAMHPHGPAARVGAPPQLPNLPQWQGPDANGWWTFTGLPRTTWRMAYEAGRWEWQYWADGSPYYNYVPVSGPSHWAVSAQPGWVPHYVWSLGTWFPSAIPKSGKVPPLVYPPINPPQLAEPPLPQRFDLSAFLYGQFMGR